MDVFKRVTQTSMWISLILSWGAVKITMAEVCHFFENTDEYFSQLSPLCRLQQSIMDSRFVWSQMTLSEAFIYSGLIIATAAFFELLVVNFQKDKWPINASNNGLNKYLMLRGGLLIGLTIFMTNTNW